MACSCKCCCGCCCDGETGEQKLERQCTSPKEFQGKGTSCDVCCDLGEIREDIDSEEDCPGTWVVNGRCQDAPCDPPSECETDEDCNEGQYCCDGVCEDEPCEECECSCDAPCGPVTIEINGHTIAAISEAEYLDCNNTPNDCDGTARDCEEYLVYMGGRWDFAKHLYSYRDWTTTIGGVEYTFTESCAPGNTSTYGYFNCSLGGEVYFHKYDSTEDWPFYEGGMQFSGTVADDGVCEDGDLVFRNFTETYCNDQADDPIADCDPEVVIRFSGCNCIEPP